MLPNNNLGYGYDAVGNRTSATIGANTYTYVYPGTSNRLSSTTGPVPAKNNSYDGAGNLTADGTNSYLYEARGRLVAATVAGVNSIRQYNGLGERTFRSPQPGISTAYAFDEAGRLIGEYTNDTVNGTLYGVEYLYLEGIVMGIAPFTVPAPGAPAQYAAGFFVYPDHLDTPRLVTDVANAVRWRWELGEPFGAEPANENPAGLGVFAFNLRFPGQYFDKETNLHYNYYRDYDPSIGRYIQSDPIGLAGGINLYSYVGGNPLSFVDLLGLAGKKDPNGEECQALARKIDNIRKDIAKRYRDYQTNPLGLPDTAPPGSRPRESRQGHLDLIRKLEERLKELEKKYAEECSPECPPEGSSRQSQSPRSSTDPFVDIFGDDRPRRSSPFWPFGPTPFPRPFPIP